MTEKPMLKRSYHIPLEMFMEAFRAFQRKYIFPFNIVYTVILLAVAGVYVRSAILDSSKTFAYVVVVFCLAFILSIWYKMLKLRRSLREALKEIENDVYEVQLFSDKLTIRTEDAPAPDEESAEPEDKPAEEVPAEETEGSDGFQQIFPEKPAEPVQSIPPTEIYFDDRVKFHEFAEFFMVYMVKQNFYVIPKKDFSEDELTTIRQAFKL